jgi:hypothetical protein
MMSLWSGGHRGDARLGRWSLSHLPGPSREYTRGDVGSRASEREYMQYTEAPFGPPTPTRSNSGHAEARAAASAFGPIWTTQP